MEREGSEGYEEAREKKEEVNGQRWQLATGRAQKEETQVHLRREGFDPSPAGTVGVCPLCADMSSESGL